MVSPNYVKNVWINQLTRDLNEIMDVVSKRKNIKIRNLRNIRQEQKVARILEKLETHYEKFAAGSKFGEILRERNRYEYKALFDVMDVGRRSMHALRNAMKSGDFSKFEAEHKKATEELVRLLNLEKTDKYFGPYSESSDSMKVPLLMWLLTSASIVFMLYGMTEESIILQGHSPESAKVMAALSTFALSIIPSHITVLVSMGAQSAFPAAIRTLFRFLNLLKSYA